MIIRVSDQLRCGEISLFETDEPEEAEAAKTGSRATSVFIWFLHQISTMRVWCRYSAFRFFVEP